MADRVHPAESLDPLESPKPLPETRLKPPPGSYVIQVPKDQVYRVPPPENAHRFQNYVRRSKRRRSPCCCCLCWTVGVIALLLLALAATAGILYLVVSPKAPNYSIDNLSIKGLNISSDRTLSPEFDVTVRAENPNKMIGISYRGGSSVTVSYSGIDLCAGTWPVFYQGTQNVTVFGTPLKGSGIRLSDSMHGQLVAEQSRGAVPLVIDVRVPVRVKFGAVTSWTITVKVRCDVKVDKLTADSKIVSKSCSVKVDI